MNVGDEVKLPPTLSEPGGVYRIVAIDKDEVRFVSKKGVKRRVRRDRLPGLFDRATPAPTTPVTADSFNRDQGVLSSAGYHVGATAAMPAVNRQIVLRRVFQMPAAQLPVGNDEAYRAEWGEASSEERLGKMMRCLDNFILLHLKRAERYQKAIVEWKEDLKWLVRELKGAKRA